MHVLETVRRGISRKEIDDIAKLKQAIKSELLSILNASEQNGVASEASVPESIAPYVMMIRRREWRRQNDDDRQAGAANQSRGQRRFDLRGRHVRAAALINWRSG